MLVNNYVCKAVSIEHVSALKDSP